MSVVRTLHLWVAAAVHISSYPGLVREALSNLDMRRRSRDAVTDGRDAETTVPAERLRAQQHTSDPGFVPISTVADLERCLDADRDRRSHTLQDANAEMRSGGVGDAEETEPAPLTLREAVGRPVGRNTGFSPSLPPLISAPHRRRRGRGSSPVGIDEEPLPAEPPREAWESLDQIDLAGWFRKRILFLKTCPHFIRGRYRHAQHLALEFIDKSSNEVDACRGWKAFGLLSTMPLHRPRSTGSVGRTELEKRTEAFARGEWTALLEAAASSISTSRVSNTHRTPEYEQRLKREQSCAKVRLEELSKARQVLSRATLAPGTQETLTQLQARQPTLTEAIPEEVLTFQPEVAVDIEFRDFVAALKSAPRGASGGPGGTTNEHLKIALDDEDTAGLLHKCAVRLARANVPQDIAAAYMYARVTALRKPNGRVRDIAAGTCLRRLVASCLAKKVVPEIEQACAPYQYALSTRAGTECVGHLFRAATDSDATATVLSIDGIGAFDHVRRSAMLRKLHQLDGAKAVLSFVRLSSAEPTKYVWTDAAGIDHFVAQGEGGEQGDPLMPLLFALGIHDAFHDVAQRLRPGEDICAFLGDVYVLCSPERVRSIYDQLSEALKRIAGIELHNGKTKVWNRASHRPPGRDGLGGQDGAWRPHGLILLGVPLGTAEYIAEPPRERLAEEVQLLEEIAKLPDPQCATQLLVRCAVQRGNFWIRTIAPNMAEDYATQRDAALWGTICKILCEENPVNDQVSRTKAQLPARLGGLELRSTHRGREAAYWASWADALGMIKLRNPGIARTIVDSLESGQCQNIACLHQLQRAAQVLDAEGFDARPDWKALADGLRPPPLEPMHRTDGSDHGWQYFASSTRETFARTALLSRLSRSERAMLRSQSGLGAALTVLTAPTSRECTLQPGRSQAAMRRRVRWPLALAGSK